MSPTSTHSALSESDYQERVREVLIAIEAQTDRWLQQDLVDIDSARTGGLLELSLPDGSKLIVNAQPPLQELWLAARRGGFHFRQVDGHWLDTKSGAEFWSLLSACASEQAGLPLSFTA